MGKSTISMAIFNSFLYVYQRVPNVVVERWTVNLLFINLGGILDMVTILRVTTHSRD